MDNSWVAAFNLLFPIINREYKKEQSDISLFEPTTEDPAYFSGSRFIKLVQQFDPSIPHYKEFLNQRNAQGKGTNRREFFYDILKEQTREIRIAILEKIITEIQDQYPEEIKEVQLALLGHHTVNKAVVSEHTWNATRLNSMFNTIDQAIASDNYERAITLCYTCIEGLFKSFIQKNIPTQSSLNEIIKMSREIRSFINDKDIYQEEICNSIINIAALINTTRNKYSEAHFNHQADNILSIYIRDLANSLAKLIIQNMD